MYETAIRVDAVGLPNVLKKDIGKINKATEPEKTEQMGLDIKRSVSKLKAIESLKSSIEKDNYLKKLKIIKGLQKTTATNGTATGISKTIQTISNRYVSTLKELIREYWKIPAWVEGKNLKTVILVLIDDSGKVIKADFYERSGDENFDNIAFASVQKAAPFPPPPLSLKKRLKDEGVLLSFP
jgi:TonB family protein